VAAPRLTAVPGAVDEPVVTLFVAVGRGDMTADPDRLRQLIENAMASSLSPAPRDTNRPRLVADQLVAGSLRMDLSRMELFVDDELVALTRQELLLLKVLMEHQGRVLTRTQLLEQAWDYNEWSVGRTVDVHVRRLRVKLGRNGRRIVTVRGFGYRFDT
jgi:DNA-binding response OmpR family regulator